MSNQLDATKANTIAHDFTCKACGLRYELKSRGAAEPRKIVDGAYASMISQIRKDKAPSLALLQYDKARLVSKQGWSVDRLTIIPPVFLTELVIEARKPLSLSAKRAGWQGCNIRLDLIPADGKIVVIADGCVKDQVAVGGSMHRLKSLQLSHPKNVVGSVYHSSWCEA